MVISTTDSKENQQEKRLCYIYRHIRLDTNEVFYIGKGTNSSGRYERSKSKYRDNSHWHNVVNKHDYKIEIVVEELTEKEANEKEIQLILDYGRIDLGTGTLVNKTAGGEGSTGYKHNEESLKKMSEANKGNTTWLGRKHTEETLNKMRGKKRTPEQNERNRQAQLGRKLSEEHIEKLRRRIVSEETRKKISNARKGRKHSEETRKKQSDAKKGKPRSEETINKMRNRKPTPENVEKMSKKVGQYKDNILIKEYPSVSSTKLEGYCPGHVGACCRGERNHHKGFQWKFL